jgi:hypothetical protein
MNKIICIGNGSANADQQARSIALKNNITYNGVLDVKTELVPGCYHTSVQDITLSYLLDKVASSDVDLVALKEFFSYNDKLDKSRNVALDDYIPELETCRALITKQI